MKKRMIILIGTIVVIAVSTVILLRMDYINREKEIENRQKSFFGVDGLWGKTIETIEKCKEIFGDPLRINVEYDDQGMRKYTYTILVYDDFNVKYFHSHIEKAREERAQFANIRLTNPNMELWRGHIKLGGTRQEVEKAFGHLRSVEVATDCYHDSWWNVGFDFDEEDIVTGIILFGY